MLETLTINPDELAKTLGVPSRDITLPDGKVMTEYDWTSGEHLGQAAAMVKSMALGKGRVEILGHGPSWLFGALTCAAYPNQVSVFVNPLQSLVDVFSAPTGENPDSTKIAITVSGQENRTLIEVTERPVDGAKGVPEMIGYYRDHYKELQVPVLPSDEILFISGKAVNFVLMSIIQAYMSRSKVIYVKNFGEDQYTCIYTTDPAHAVGQKAK